METSNKVETSFGSLEEVLNLDGKLIAELAIFTSNGRPHKHDQWEICYVLKGEGLIKFGGYAYHVVAGDEVQIPPQTDHYMEVDKGHKLVILIAYSDKTEAERYKVCDNCDGNLEGLEEEVNGVCTSCRTGGYVQNPE